MRLEMICEAIQKAIDELDDSGEWLAGIPAPWAKDENTLAAIKSLETALEKYLQRQRAFVLSALKRIPIHKAANEQKPNKSFLRLFVQAMKGAAQRFLSELTEIYLSWAGPLLRSVSLSVRADLPDSVPATKLSRAASKWMKKHSIQFAREVNKTTHKAVIRILSKGISEGKSISDMAEELRGLPEFDWKRARFVARTETISAANAGTLEVWRQSEAVEGKIWICANNERSRDAHKQADGQAVALDEPFVVGGYRLMHPGDSSLGAPAKLVCNCRCVMRAKLKERR